MNGTVASTNRPSATPTAGAAQVYSQRSTSGPPTNPTIAITPNSTAEPTFRIFGGHAGRAIAIATIVMATAISALHATPLPANRVDISENAIQGRNPVINESGFMPITLEARDPADISQMADLRHRVNPAAHSAEVDTGSGRHLHPGPQARLGQH